MLDLVPVAAFGMEIRLVQVMTFNLGTSVARKTAFSEPQVELQSSMHCVWGCQSEENINVVNHASYINVIERTHASFCPFYVTEALGWRYTLGSEIGRLFLQCLSELELESILLHRRLLQHPSS